MRGVNSGSTPLRPCVRVSVCCHGDVLTWRCPFCMCMDVKMSQFYLATLKEAEALQQLMNDMTAAGNKAATAFLKVPHPHTRCYVLWDERGNALWMGYAM